MKVSSLESISLMKVEQGRIKAQVEVEVLGILYTDPFARVGSILSS